MIKIFLTRDLGDRVMYMGVLPVRQSQKREGFRMSRTTLQMVVNHLESTGNWASVV